MKARSPSSRLILPDRRHLLRLGLATAGASILACNNGESEASAAGGGGGGSASCAEPDPTDGERLFAVGDGEIHGEMQIKAAVARLSNNFGLMVGSVPAKYLLAPHTHELDDQVVYVINGELEFEFGDGDKFLAPTGSFVIKPRYIWHSFWNPSPTVEVEYIEMSTRTTFEPFVKALPDAETKAEMDALAAEAGITFEYDQIPRLMAENMLLGIRGMEMPSPSEFLPSGLNPAG